MDPNTTLNMLLAELARDDCHVRREVTFDLLTTLTRDISEGADLPEVQDVPDMRDGRPAYKVIG